MATDTHTHSEMLEALARLEEKMDCRFNRIDSRLNSIESRMDVMTLSIQQLTKWASNFPQFPQFPSQTVDNSAQKG